MDILPTHRYNGLSGCYLTTFGSQSPPNTRAKKVNKKKLGEMRDQLDSIDASILQLLSCRFDLTREIGAMKAHEQWPAQDAEREEEQFERLSNLAADLSIPERLVLLIYRNIIDTVLEEHRHYG